MSLGSSMSASVMNVPSSATLPATRIEHPCKGGAWHDITQVTMLSGQAVISVKSQARCRAPCLLQLLLQSEAECTGMGPVLRTKHMATYLLTAQ